MKGGVWAEGGAGTQLPTSCLCVWVECYRFGPSAIRREVCAFRAGRCRRLPGATPFLAWLLPLLPQLAAATPAMRVVAVAVPATLPACRWASRWTS